MDCPVVIAPSTMTTRLDRRDGEALVEANLCL